MAVRFLQSLVSDLCSSLFPCCTRPPPLPASTPAAHTQQILKIHLLGQPATGELKRPFEAPPGLMDAATKAANAVDEKKPATAIAPAKDEKKKDK